MMRQLISHVITRIVSLIESSTIEEISSYCDTLETFYNFIATIAKKMPPTLVENDIEIERLISQSKYLRMIES